MLQDTLEALAQRTPTLAGELRALGTTLATASTDARSIARLCELARATGSVKLVEEYAWEHQTMLDKCTKASQLSLALAIMSPRLRTNPVDPPMREVTRGLLRRAGDDWGELSLVRRIARAHIDLNDLRALFYFLQRVLGRHVEWDGDPILTQLRGHAWLNLARRERRTLELDVTDAQVRYEADRDMNEYVGRAKYDLLSAIQAGLEGEALASAEADLRLIRELWPPKSPPPAPHNPHPGA
ncbi:hypothetical protein L6R49_16105 [Myxococcota bacterium]|nr:hypothetical protein [Myxococcota bacterium]